MAWQADTFRYTSMQSLSPQSLLLRSLIMLAKPGLGNEESEVG